MCPWCFLTPACPCRRGREPGEIASPIAKAVVAAARSRRTMTWMAQKKKPAKRRKGFSDEEKAAMRERARETKAGAGKSDLLAKIAEMSEPDRAMAERIHALVTDVAPDLEPKTWYGMPAYAKDGQVVCFFQPAAKFKARYATFGFNEKANLDEGSMWPTSWALTKLTKAAEKQIAALVRQAAS
jgi:uncharacterized protein YdhG (YjbR/CyaY superfamily)